MCVVSMVSGHYEKRWPFNEPSTFPSTFPGGIGPAPQAIPNNPFQQLQQFQPSELAELRKILQEFREAMAAAKRVDELTAQPDCEDAGKKSALEASVTELEKRLDAMGPTRRVKKKKAKG